MRLLTRRFDTAGLLVLRVVVGALVAAHGLQKLTTAGPGGFGRETLAALGVPLPVLAGYVVTFAELVGGVLLILGLLTRLAALVTHRRPRGGDPAGQGERRADRHEGCGRRARSSLHRRLRRPPAHGA